MDPAKQKLLELIAVCTKPEAQNKALALANEALQRGQEGNLSKSYLTGLLPRMLPLLKPEYAHKIKSVILQYAMGGMHNAFGD